jgi:hypothetical protein
VTPADSTPDWIRDAVAKLVEEVRRFVATAWGMTMRPTDFAAGWVSGRVRALNPIAFFATAMAALVPLQRQFNIEAGAFPKDVPLRIELAAAAAPYLIFVGLGLFSHPILRLLRARRPLRTTLGIALLIGGGPATVVGVPMVALQILLVRHVPLSHGADMGKVFAQHPYWMGSVFVLSTVGFAFYVVQFVRALAAAHGVRVWRPLVALPLAMVLNVAAFYVLGAVFLS